MYKMRVDPNWDEASTPIKEAIRKLRQSNRSCPALIDQGFIGEDPIGHGCMNLADSQTALLIGGILFQLCPKCRASIAGRWDESHAAKSIDLVRPDGQRHRFRREDPPLPIVDL